ncbi:beta-ketoacyl synthase N-terminal-like domain-containing protein, partial [Streptomyces tailanensis]|uniref:beta-ketoacyl synthase N-terminal-like domain-containing protein n=1 Tax=Streptomyces tailanensis TaxID=2569858 RepID=UPI00122E5C7F
MAEESPNQSTSQLFSSAVPLPWLLSAGGVSALRTGARHLRDAVLANPSWLPRQVAGALAPAGGEGTYRAVLLGHSLDELADAAQALAAGEPSSGCVEGRIESQEDGGEVLFVFPGHGSQWEGMAARLLEESPLFAERMGQFDRALAAYVDWSLLDVVRGTGGAPPLIGADVVQPALVATMVSLADLWRSCGIRPAAALGHSIGEIAAACFSGALSLADTARVSMAWGAAQERLAGRGEMLSVRLPAAQVEERLARWGDRLVVAALNGPRSVVVSGDTAAVAELHGELEAEGIRTRKVAMGLASHSPQIDEVLPRLREELDGVRPGRPSLPLYSSFLGGPLGEQPLDAGFWCRSLRGRIDFEPAVRAALRDGLRVSVEVGPHPLLTSGVQETAEELGAPVTVSGTLWRGDGGAGRFLASLAQLHVAGVTPDWGGVLAGADGAQVQLPQGMFEADDDDSTEDAGSLRERLAGLPHAVRVTLLRELVCAHAGAVLGVGTVEAELPFRASGLDSVRAVELRRRLAAPTGLALPSTAAFDHPTPAALAGYLAGLLSGESGADAHEEAAAADVPGAGDDPIAVVAVGCRFPGGVRSPEDLWQVLVNESDVVGDLPDDRGWDIGGRYSAETTGSGTFIQREGGFLDGAGEFDAEFFGIAPREALAMDPQQRLLLETSWELFERAGIDPATLKGSRTGVYVGAMPMDYGPRASEAGDSVAGHVLTGTTGSVASGRISYVYGFEGPAVTVDTACSSSLVSLHLACQSLRQGESTLAVAGGVTVLPTLSMFTEFTRQRALAPDGRCKAFSSSADGFGLAEGVGLVLLERLSDARRRGHRVLA